MNPTKKFTNVSYDNSKLPTNRYISSLDEYSPRKEEFEALYARFSQVPWSYMVTVTFKKPVTDQIFVEKFCAEYKKRLFKYLYGVSKKYEQIKICSFIEPHMEFHASKRKLHAHILVTNPEEVRESVIRFKSVYEEIGIKLFESCLEQTLKQLSKAEFFRNRCPVGDQYDIRPVDNKNRIADYCLKGFRSGRAEIAWEGTNVSWSN